MTAEPGRSKSAEQVYHMQLEIQVLRRFAVTLDFRILAGKPELHRSFDWMTKQLALELGPVASLVAAVYTAPRKRCHPGHNMPAAVDTAGWATGSIASFGS